MTVGAMMPVDAKEALTRKLGPLPAWGWGVAIGGAVLVARLFRGGGKATTTGNAPTSIGSGAVIGSGPDASTQPGDIYGGPNSLIEQLQTEVGSLTEKATGQEGTIAGLSTSIATLTDFQALQTKLVAYLNRRSSILQGIAVTQSNISDYRQNLAACTTAACKSKWNAQITQKQGYLTSYNAEMATLDKQISDTQAQLNGSNS